MKHVDAYVSITDNICVVTFVKKNGDVRCMLATRDTDISNKLCGYFVGSLGSRDRRNINNPNTLAVIDLEIGEIRSLVTDRILVLSVLDSPKSSDEFSKLLSSFDIFKSKYMETIEQTSVSIDDLDEENIGVKSQSNIVEELLEELKNYKKMDSLKVVSKSRVVNNNKVESILDGVKVYDI